MKENKQAQCGGFNPSEKPWRSRQRGWPTAVIRLSTRLTGVEAKNLVASARTTLRTEEDLNGACVCM